MSFPEIIQSKTGLTTSLSVNFTAFLFEKYFLHSRTGFQLMVMKKNILFILANVIVFAAMGQSLWAQEDKNFLIKELQSTEAALLNEIHNLSEEQMNFKPDSNSWSIAQVVEHVAVYDELLFWDLFYGQYTPERPDLAKKVKGNDKQFLAYATDKSKGNSPWIALPIGRFGNKEGLMKYFIRFREKIITYIKETECDFRLHFTYRAPGGGIWTARDLHQHTLIWIAHTERHTNQIKRIKADNKFPGS